MYELTTGADVLSLQALPVAGSVVTDEVTGLARKHRRSGGGGGRKNVCLITLSNSLNGLEVLNILNNFGI